MSPEQAAYALALAKYETARDLAKAAKTASGIAFPENMTEAELDRMITREINIEEACGVFKLEAALIDAEAALIAWGHQQIKQLPQYADHREDLEALFRMANMSSVHKKLVALTFKLHV
jgi:hypothetical protein